MPSRVNLEFVCINALVAQSVKRGANNAKVMCLKLLRTRFHFLGGIISVFNEFAYIQCLKIINLEFVCINGLVAQSVERGASNSMVMCSKLIRTSFPFCVD